MGFPPGSGALWEPGSGYPFPPQVSDHTTHIRSSFILWPTETGCMTGSEPHRGLSTWDLGLSKDPADLLHSCAPRTCRSSLSLCLTDRYPQTLNPSPVQQMGHSARVTKRENEPEGKQFPNLSILEAKVRAFRSTEDGQGCLPKENAALHSPVQGPPLLAP